MKLNNFKNNFIYLFLAVLGLVCCKGFYLVAASRSYSLVAVHRWLIAVAPPVVECGLWGVLASAVAAGGLSSHGAWTQLLHGTEQWGPPGLGF